MRCVRTAARGVVTGAVALAALVGVLPLSGQAVPLERNLAVAFEYPGVEISASEPVTVGILLQNKGGTDETLQLSIAEAPKGWSSAIRSGELTVTGVFLPAGQSRTLSFETVPPSQPVAGQYEFRMTARSADGGWTDSQVFNVSVRARSRAGRGGEEIGLTTAYPVLRGPAEVSYEFTLELENKREEDVTFDLFARGPEGWETNFKPVYEPRYISSFQIRARQSKKLVVEVKPPRDAPAGEYPVSVRISSDGAAAELPLTIIITGTYEISVATASGSLSVGAIRGKPATIDLFVKNTGTALQSHIGLFAYNPENWDVRFEPERIDGLQPGQTQEVKLAIVPYERALVGDYSVEIRANGEKVSEPLEFRVTVNASAAFGWIGIAIIILVIGGLVVLFRWLGRR
ncbi:MAG: hypothetical protein JW820_12600 [Spirochaetales bacterium]|nr:hypothetical protein [Spirochaetales bacterium]